MALAVAGVVHSPAQREHGKAATCCCLHPTRRTLFMAAGQVVDEVDTRDGSVVSRIVTDLAEPIVRMEVCAGSKGHEYLVLISSGNEARVWDLEARFHLGAVQLGGAKPSAALRSPAAAAAWSASSGLSAVTTSTGHERCLLLYARPPGATGTTATTVASDGSVLTGPVVEVLHLQRQIDKPGSPALLTVLEPKAALARSPAVTALAVHPALPLVAAGTAEGIVTVWSCPWLRDPAVTSTAPAAGGGGAGAEAGAAAAEGGDDDDSGSGSGGDFANAAANASVASRGHSSGHLGSPGRSVSGRASALGGSGGGGAAGATSAREGSGGSSGAGAMVLFAAAISPDYGLVGGRIRKNAAASPLASGGAAGGGPGTPVASASGGAYPSSAGFPANPSAVAQCPLPGEPIETVTALAFHPSLPLLAAADASGRIVVWRVGVDDGKHATLASRNGCAPPTGDGCPRAVTSLTFHSLLPRLVTTSYAPTGPATAPLLAAWCYAHASLPPLPDPTTPALATLLHAATSDPLATLQAHMTAPPTLLAGSAHGGPRGTRQVVWAAGKAVVVTEVVSASAAIGVTGEDESLRASTFGLLQTLQRSLTTSGAMSPASAGAAAYGAGLGARFLQAPLIPHGATGIGYGAPCVDTITAPRHWFVAGGEGDGCDLAADAALDGLDAGGLTTTGTGGAGGGSALDDGLDLASFAAKLVAEAAGSGSSSSSAASGGGKKGGEGGGAGGSGAVPLLASGTPAKPHATGTGPLALLTTTRGPPPVSRPSVDAAVYIQTKTAVIPGPPARFVWQHSLQVRPLGASVHDSTVAAQMAAADALASAAAGDAADPAALASAASAAIASVPESPAATAQRLDTSGALLARVKRLCWLPSYGPGGPVVPVSLERSPSGRFYVVRFAYVTEASPSKLAALAAATGNGSGSGTGYANKVAPVGSAGSPVSLERLTGSPSADNAAAATPSDAILYCIVGPITDSADTYGLPVPAGSGGSAGSSGASAGPLPDAVDDTGMPVGDAGTVWGAPLAYESLATGCPVSGLSSAVEAVVLPGDRLMTVKRPAAAALASGASSSAAGAALTEYVTTIEPLELVITDVSAKTGASSASAAASSAAGGAGGAHDAAAAGGAGAAAASSSSTPATRLAAVRKVQVALAKLVAARRQRRIEASMCALKFATHEPLVRCFYTPFRTPPPPPPPAPVDPAAALAAGAVPQVVVMDDGEADDEIGTLGLEVDASAHVAGAVAAGGAGADGGGSATPAAAHPGAPVEASYSSRHSDDHSIDGDVMLVATRWRDWSEAASLDAAVNAASAGASGSGGLYDAGDEGGEGDADAVSFAGIAGCSRDRVVLRYTNNAFAHYARSNPHAYAVTHAYTTLSSAGGRGGGGGTSSTGGVAAVGAPEPIGRAEAAALAASSASTGGAPGAPGVSADPFSVPAAAPPAAAGAATASGTGIRAPTTPAGAAGRAATGPTAGPSAAALEAAGQWTEHAFARGLVPTPLRPALVLAPGEAVVRVSFSGWEQGRADAALHDLDAAAAAESAASADASAAAASDGKPKIAALGGGLAAPAGGGIRRLGGPAASATARAIPGAGSAAPAPASSASAGGASGSAAGGAGSKTPATTIRFPRPTLYEALATGGPLIAVLTSHRLLLVSAGLQILAAVPVFAPLASATGSGLGTCNPAAAGSSPLSATAAALALACGGPSFSLWRGMAAGGGDAALAKLIPLAAGGAGAAAASGSGGSMLVDGDDGSGVDAGARLQAVLLHHDVAARQAAVGPTSSSSASSFTTSSSLVRTGAAAGSHAPVPSSAVAAALKDALAAYGMNPPGTGSAARASTAAGAGGATAFAVGGGGGGGGLNSLLLGGAASGSGTVRLGDGYLGASDSLPVAASAAASAAGGPSGVGASTTTRGGLPVSTLPWQATGVASGCFGTPAPSHAPMDASATVQGGRVVGTVASAAAVAGRLSNPLPASRYHDAQPNDDVPVDAVSATGSAWVGTITSFCWCGSALLFTTASTGADVWYLTPLGRARRLLALDGNGRDADAVLLAALPDRLVYASTCVDASSAPSYRGGLISSYARAQIRYRPFNPCEALVAGALDHAIVRPRPSLASLLSAWRHAAGSASGSTAPPADGSIVPAGPAAAAASLAALLSFGTHPLLATVMSSGAHFLRFKLSFTVYTAEKGADALARASKQQQAVGASSGAPKSSSALGAKPLSAAGTGRAGASAAPHTGVRVITLTGAAALAAAPLLALARDYAFCRDVIARYAHPNRPGGVGGVGAAPLSQPATALIPADWGLSRVVVAALQERGLIDLAAYAAQGHPRAGDKEQPQPASATAAGGDKPGGHAGAPEEEDHDATAAAAAAKSGGAWLSSATGFARRGAALVLPPHWRAELALRRGRPAQALAALVSDDPQLASALTLLTRHYVVPPSAVRRIIQRGLGDDDDDDGSGGRGAGGDGDDAFASGISEEDLEALHAVRWPHAGSPAAAKLRALAALHAVSTAVLPLAHDQAGGASGAAMLQLVPASTVRHALVAADAAGDVAAATAAATIAAALAAAIPASTRPLHDSLTARVAPGSINLAEAMKVLAALAKTSVERLPAASLAAAAATLASGAAAALVLAASVVAAAGAADDDDASDDDHDSDDDRYGSGEAAGAAASAAAVAAFRAAAGGDGEVAAVLAVLGCRSGGSTGADRATRVRQDRILADALRIATKTLAAALPGARTDSATAAAASLSQAVAAHVTRGGLYAPSVLSRTARPDGGLSLATAIDTGCVAPAAPAVAALLSIAAGTLVAPVTSGPGGSQPQRAAGQPVALWCASSPFMPLAAIGATLAAMTQLEATGGSARSGVPADATTLASSLSSFAYVGTVLGGGSFNPPAPLPLLGMHLPLSADALQRWFGSAAPRSAHVGRGGMPGASSADVAAGAGAGEGDEEGGEGAVGDDVDGMGGLMDGIGGGDGGAGAMDPTTVAILAARGKKRLRPLPRGTEDAVIGYWRFERSDDEAAAEKARVAELQRGGANGRMAYMRPQSGGMWMVGQAKRDLGEGPRPECLSYWPGATPDLSKTRADAVQFDTLLLFARIRGVAAAAGLAPLPAPIKETVVGMAEFAQHVRAGFAVPLPLDAASAGNGLSAYDCPVEAGDLSKVREPRVWCGGVNTIIDEDGSGASGDAGGSPSASGGLVVPHASFVHPAAHRVNLSKAPAGAVASAQPSGCTVLPPTPITPLLRFVSTVASWGLMVPVPRYSLNDIGVRPFDPVNAVWTAEAWIKVGYPLAGSPAGAGATGGGAGGDDGSDDGAHHSDADAAGGGGSRRASSVRLRRDVAVMARMERFLRLRPAAPAAGAVPAPAAPAPSLPPGVSALSSPAVAPLLEASARLQWSIVVKTDGSLAFNSLPFAAADPAVAAAQGVTWGETLPASAAAGAASAALQTVVASAPGTVPLGEWCHIAVVVDATAAAKEAVNRIKAAAAASDAAAARARLAPLTAAALGVAGGAAAPGAPSTALAHSPLVLDAAPLPPAVVRLFIDDAPSGEGKVSTALPLPLLDLPQPPAGSTPNPLFPPIPPQAAAALDGSSDALLIGPDFIGRMGEVRLWAKRRTADEIGDSKDFHLDLAESKRTKMSVVIRPATLPAGGLAPLASPVAAAGAAAAAPKLGGGLGGLGAVAAANKRRLPSSAAAAAPGSDGGPAASPPSAGATSPAPVAASAAAAAPATPPRPPRAAAGAAGGFDGEGDGGDDFSSMHTTSPPPVTKVAGDDDDENDGSRKLRPSMTAGAAGGLKAAGLGARPLGGGLGAPPPAAGGAGSKKAALLRRKAGEGAATGTDAAPGSSPA